MKPTKAFLPLFSFLLLNLNAFSLPVNDINYIKNKTRYYSNINNGKRGNEIYIYENGKNKTTVIKTKEKDIIGLYNLKIDVEKRNQKGQVEVKRILNNINVNSNLKGKTASRKKTTLNIGTKNIKVKRSKKIYQVIENKRIIIRKK